LESQETTSEEIYEEKDQAKQFIGGIFGDDEIMKQSCVCFDCLQKNPVKEFESLFSTLVYYAPDEDKKLDFKLVKGREIQDIQIKKMNKGVRPDPPFLGERIVLGVFNGLLILKVGPQSI
tara:strand:- start:33 stop:392 length:360 start_codon:yes stop_codon:yes gene_type:complete